MRNSAFAPAFIACLCFIRLGCLSAAGSSAATAGSQAAARLKPTTAAPQSAAGSLTIIHQFGALPDGQFPVGALIADGAGALYGATVQGGTGSCAGASQQTGCGTVYKLTPSGSGYTETILYSFQGGSDGALPKAGLYIDVAGNLYGTTLVGGDSFCRPHGCGTVFELTPSGSTYTERVLYRFRRGTDGRFPEAPLIADSQGALYGTTSGGGQYHYGAVFKLKLKHGSYRETIVHSFAGGTIDGAVPLAGLVADATGALYGTTSVGGMNACAGGIEPPGCGVAYKLTPSAPGYTESVIWMFPGGADSEFPESGLTFDTSGDLYGTATGANFNGDDDGAVFELVPSASGYSELPLYDFKGVQARDGAFPSGGVVSDERGDLYGITMEGGVRKCALRLGCGTLFELVHSRGAYEERVLHRFALPGAYYPSGGLVIDAGALYGTAEGAGLSGYGVVFKFVH